MTHDVDDFNTGEDVILTLADSRVISGKRGMTKGPHPNSLLLIYYSQVCPVENNYFTEMCSGSEAGSYLRLIDFVYHSTLRVIKKKKRQ